MHQSVVFKLIGDLKEQGFQITLDIAQDGKSLDLSDQGTLPPNPLLVEHLTEFQQGYENFTGTARALKPYKIQYDGVPNPINQCREAAKQLTKTFQKWLRSESFRDLEQQLNHVLDPNDVIRVLIRSDDPQLHLLPWHLWPFIKKHPNAEIAMGPLQFQQVSVRRSKTSKVSILAILGDSTNIDIETDRQLLEQLPGAKVKLLMEPTHQEFQDQLYKQPWDILFFAGHTDTLAAGDGIIKLNSEKTFTVDELKNGLEQAIRKGLQLAIFNSCNGMGLAYALAELQLPQMIVMRQAVPDHVAHAFLKYFLKAFSNDLSLYQSERQAREQLQSLEKEFPCATWLPMIYQNSAKVPPSWQTLRNQLKRVMGWHGVMIVAIASIIAAGLILGVRSLGWLQTSELAAYNRLMQSRPIEQADNRILIVGADQSDLDKYNDPIPDEVFAKVLRILGDQNPKAIGLDAFRGEPVPPGHQELMKEIKENEKIITACSISINNVKDSVAPPNVSRQDNFSGFVDLYNDDDIDPSDATLRRYLLTRTPNPIDLNTKCKSKFSFAFLLVKKYLETDDRTVEPDEAIENWVFDGLVAPRLQADSGGYHNFDAAGYQILINYRNTGTPREVSQQINLQEILENRDSFNPDWIKDRVIILGTTAPSRHDEHHTPYGNISGPVIHGHVVSQLLSAIEDQRPLLSWWPQWMESFWIIIWAAISSLLIYVFKHPIYRGGICLSLTLVIWLLVQQCFSNLGLWIPVSPVILVILLASILIVLNENIRKVS